MKKIILLLLCSLVFNGCKDDEPDHGIYVKSFVLAYLDGDIKFDMMVNNYWTISLVSNDNFTELPCPELAKYELEKVEYLKIATQNGDLSYNDYHYPLPGYHYTCFKYNLRSVSVKSDKAWDETHSAGIPLDDIACVRLGTYAPYIANGYKPIEYIDNGEHRKRIFDIIDKPAKDLVESDLQMINSDDLHLMSLFFATPPADPTAEHTLTVTLTTTEGKVYTVTGTGVPPVKKPE